MNFFHHKPEKRAFFTLDGDRDPTEFTQRNKDLVNFFFKPDYEILESDSLQKLPTLLHSEPSKYALIIVYVPSEQVFELHKKDISALTPKLNFLLILDGITNLEPQCMMIMSKGPSPVEGQVLVSFIQGITAVYSKAAISERVAVKVHDAASSPDLTLVGGKNASHLGDTTIRHFHNEPLRWDVMVSASTVDGQITGDPAGPGFALSQFATESTVKVLPQGQQELRLELSEDAAGMEKSLEASLRRAINVQAIHVSSLGEGIYSVMVPHRAVGDALHALSHEQRATTIPAGMTLSFVSICYTYRITGKAELMMKYEASMRLGDVHGDLEARIEDVSGYALESDPIGKPPLTGSNRVSRTNSNASATNDRKQPHQQPIIPQQHQPVPEPYLPPPVAPESLHRSEPPTPDNQSNPMSRLGSGAPRRQQPLISPELGLLHNQQPAVTNPHDVVVIRTTSNQSQDSSRMYGNSAWRTPSRKDDNPAATTPHGGPSIVVPPLALHQANAPPKGMISPQSSMTNANPNTDQHYHQDPLRGGVSEAAVDAKIADALREQEKRHHHEMELLRRELRDGLASQKDSVGIECNRVVEPLRQSLQNLGHRYDHLENRAMPLSPVPQGQPPSTLALDVEKLRSSTDYDIRQLRRDIEEVASRPQAPPVSLPDLSHLMTQARGEQIYEDLIKQIPTRKQVSGAFEIEFQQSGIAGRLAALEEFNKHHPRGDQSSASSSAELAALSTRLNSLETQYDHTARQMRDVTTTSQESQRGVGSLQQEVDRMVADIRGNGDVIRSLQAEVRMMAQKGGDIKADVAQEVQRTNAPQFDKIRMRMDAMQHDLDAAKTTLENRTDYLRKATTDLELKVNKSADAPTHHVVEGLQRDLEALSSKQRQTTHAVESLEARCAHIQQSANNREDLRDIVQGVVLPQTEPIKTRIVQLEGELKAVVGSLDSRYAQRDRTEDVLRDQRRNTDDSIEKVVQSFSQRLFVVETRLDGNMKRLVAECRELCHEEIGLAEQRSDIKIANSPARSQLEASPHHFQNNSNGRTHPQTPVRQIGASPQQQQQQLLSPRYEEMELVKSFCNRNATDLKDIKSRMRQLEMVQSEVTQLLAGEDEHLQALEKLEMRLIKLENRR